VLPTIEIAENIAGYKQSKKSDDAGYQCASYPVNFSHFLPLVGFDVKYRGPGNKDFPFVCRPAITGKSPV